MIPYSHILLLALFQFSLGLLGMLLRRSAIVVLVSALVMFNGVLLILCVGGGGELITSESNSSGCQTAGLAVLAIVVALATVGVAILYTFHRFLKTVDLDEHDRMKH